MCHWGQNDYLPTFAPDKLFKEIACVCVKGKEMIGESMLNCPVKITLPKSVANQLGNVFVPNGMYLRESTYDIIICSVLKRLMLN